VRRAIPRERLGAPLGDTAGLSGDAARARAVAFGPNDIVEVVADRWRLLARETVRDPMIWFLVGTSALYLVLGDRAEAFTLLAALLPLIGMDAFLHRRTQASTEGLSSRLAATARLVRDGREQELPASAAVPGDAAMVDAGEAFPADGVIVSGDGLQVDESALTGEAYPVRKTPLAALPPGAEPMVDGEHLCFAGTRLLTGRARTRIAFTGGETLYGEIVRSATGGGQARTPLQAAVARLVLVMVAAATAFCLLLAGVRLAQGHGGLDALVSAVTLAVAALPEEFPVALTFFLGVGVYRLARRRALVRRAVSVENIGRVTAICSDKTGTITEGQLRLARIVPAADGGEAFALRVAALASRDETGDPLDAAILEEAGRRGHVAVPSLATHPFTESRRRETAIARDGARVIAATKGSPEVVLPMTTLDPAARADWEERVARLAGGGQKVIACAWRAVLEGAGGEPEGGYAFAGLLECEDPVREGVPEAVRSCREAGIHVVMVSGDHAATARAVARAIGLGEGGEPQVVSADELDGAPGRRMRGVDVIARAVPAQKVALVRALQAQGEVVAVTGDGVNDVPALQAADVGIAMGERGTRSARETAAIVLLDDNFRTIVGAIAEGRQLFRNLQLGFHYLLVVHIPFVLTATLIPLLGYPLLYLPIHIVWLETIIHPTAMLAFHERPSGERLIAVRARRAARFFAPADWGVIAASGLLLAAAMIAAYDHALGASGRVEHARSLALAMFCLGSASCGAALSRLRTTAARVVTLGTAALSALLIQSPGLAAAVHVEPLHLDDWAVAAAGSLLAVALPSLAQETRAFFRGPQFLPAAEEPIAPKG
jgi:Ca2+-transporting ATPase